MAKKTTVKPEAGGKENSRQKKRSPLKGTLIALVCVVLCGAIVWFSMCCIAAYQLLNPERAKLLHIDGPVELNMVYEYFAINDYNGKDQVVGWWIPCQDEEGEIIESDKTVIFSHNYEASREMIPVSGLFIARYLVYSGYNVVTFDYSGSGNAEGKNYTFGAQETDELLLVIDYVKNTREQDKIALMGWAFGAAAAINAGCQSPYVDAIVADSSYTDLQSYMEKSVHLWTRLPKALFSSTVNALLPVFADYPIWNSSPITAVSNTSGKNFLFLHGLQDTVFPYTNSVTLRNAALDAGNNAEIKLFENTSHIYGFMDNEELYITTVVDFLAEYMN